MNRIAVALLVLSAGLARADVKTEEKSQVQFPGMLGRMMGLFGGKAMRQGVIDTVAVKGNRKMTVNDTTGRIIDLDEQKIYDVDLKAKSYKVLTFEEMRRQMEQMEQRARSEQQKAEPSAAPASDPNAKQMQMDFDLKETGQKKTINGFDCREVVMTITVREKDKTLEQAGGMVMTTHEWLAPRIAAMKEIADFDRRYQEKLNGPSYAVMPSAEEMAAAAAMYPMLTQAIGKFNVENVNMNGTPIQTLMTVESVASAQQLQEQQKEQQNAQKNESSNTGIPTSVGGLLGGIGRRAVRNRTQQQEQKQENATPGRATILTMNHELLKAGTDVGAGDVAIPAGFKQKK